MRTRNSFVNFITAIVTQILNIVILFGLRTVFIKMLSTEYLGMNGLFSNILGFLSFAELGFGAAIAFSLYKPLAENDERSISGIMNFFRKVYLTVGAFVLTAGLAIAPFIEFFINDSPDIPYLKLIYSLFVINSAASYLGSYKATLIIADQKKYIVENNNFLFKIVTALLQLVALVAFQDYVLYLVAAIAGTIGNNISITIIANKKYPFIKQNSSEKIHDKHKAEIKRNVKATIMHKIGAVVIWGTDNILLSKFFSLTTVALYSNYYLVISHVNNLLGQIQASVVASVGNLGVEAADERKLEVFKTYFLLNFWIFGFSSVCLLVMFNQFIELWIGKEFFLPLTVVAVLVLNYFLAGFRSAAASFTNAFGLFWNTRYVSVIESAINLALSIVLLLRFGYIGVFLGTTVSSVATGLWYEPYVLYKKGFHQSPSKYYVMASKCLIVMLIDVLLCWYVINSIPFTGGLWFIVKCVIVFALSNLVLLVFYFKSPQFKSLLNVLSGLVTGIFRKIRKGEG